LPTTGLKGVRIGCLQSVQPLVGTEMVGRHAAENGGVSCMSVVIHKYW
jgi:hypothetical protein